MADFKKQQERLWNTVDKFKAEYGRYLKSLSKEELEEELLELMVDRQYAIFTTDLVMNVFLEEGLLDEKEANGLPTDYFKAQIQDLKEKRLGKKKSVKKTAKKTAKKKVAKKKTTKKKGVKKKSKR